MRKAKLSQDHEIPEGTESVTVHFDIPKGLRSFIPVVAPSWPTIAYFASIDGGELTINFTEPADEDAYLDWAVLAS